MSIVLIRLRAVVYKKVFTLGDAIGFQISRWGKWESELGGEDIAIKKDLEESFPDDSRVHTLLSSTL